MLIFDEVQTGFGRTGKWAAHHHYNILPDISTWAKSMGGGMPIGCVMGRAEVMDGAAPGTIGGTYLGNPVCAAAAVANIRYMKEIDINKKAGHVGSIIRKRFEDMKKRLPIIGEVRGIGAMLAIALVRNNDPWQPEEAVTKKLIENCMKRGLILLSAGTYKNIIRILSPLTISDELLNKGLDILDEELTKLSAA